MTLTCPVRQRACHHVADLVAWQCRDLTAMGSIGEPDRGTRYQLSNARTGHGRVPGCRAGHGMTARGARASHGDRRDRDGQPAAGS